eukprot:gene3960-8412_t
MSTIMTAFIALLMALNNLILESYAMNTTTSFNTSTPMHTHSTSTNLPGTSTWDGENITSQSPTSPYNNLTMLSNLSSISTTSPGISTNTTFSETTETVTSSEFASSITNLLSTTTTASTTPTSVIREDIPLFVNLQTRDSTSLDFAACICDLTTSCDPNCCCDTDCNEAMRTTFTRCDYPELQALQRCVYDTFSRINSPHETQTVMSVSSQNILCIVRENRQDRLSFRQPKTPANNLAFDTFLNALSRPYIAFLQHLFTLVPSTETVEQEVNPRSTYGAEVLMSNFHSLPLPSDTLHGQCASASPVRLFKDQSVTCTRYITSLERECKPAGLLAVPFPIPLNVTISQFGSLQQAQVSFSK